MGHKEYLIFYFWIQKISDLSTHLLTKYGFEMSIYDLIFFISKH